MKKIIYNDHHRIPKSKGGTNHVNNILRIDVKTHDAIHRVFHNDTPVEQIERLMTAINSKVLTAEFKRDILRILEEEDLRYFYRGGTYK